YVVISHAHFPTRTHAEVEGRQRYQTGERAVSALRSVTVGAAENRCDVLLGECDADCATDHRRRRDWRRRFLK
ncbi:MAG TPA: hypothetical protein PKD55_19425, partial [Bellilinea sp.]|nr:hypothetical protein [Bellilinea sp.]